MPNAYFSIERPANDPFKGYLPGSAERAGLKAELERQSNEVVKIPLIIGGKEVRTEKTIQVTMPHDHHHVIAECCMAGEEELWTRRSPRKRRGRKCRGSIAPPSS